MSKFYDFDPKLVSNVNLNKTQLAAAKQLDKIAKEVI
jgi:hypothetical protein